MVKLIVAILKDEDSDPVTKALSEINFCVSRIASTGGFFRQGQSTLMVGVEEKEVDRAIQVINESCSPVRDPLLRRVTLFVMNVEHFERI